jgi:hypothetical protein
MKGITAVFALVLAFFLFCWAVPADAYERGRPWLSDQPWEKFSVSFGLFVTNFDSNVTLTGSGAGVLVNFEDLLGLDTTTTQYRINAQYRAWRRHHFYFSFFDLSRQSESTLLGDIPETDPPVTAGALVASNLDMKIYQVGYTFSFWNDDRVDLGAGLGFYIMDLGTGLGVLAGAEGGEEIAGKVLVAESITAPLPVLNMRANVAITKRVFLKNSFNVFYINMSGFEGLLLDTSIALEGHICRFFGLGMGFNFLTVEIEGDGEAEFLGGSWNGKLNFDYTGLSIYGKFFF